MSAHTHGSAQPPPTASRRIPAFSKSAAAPRRTGRQLRRSFKQRKRSQKRAIQLAAPADRLADSAAQERVPCHRRASEEGRERSCAQCACAPAQNGRIPLQGFDARLPRRRETTSVPFFGPLISRSRVLENARHHAACDVAGSRAPTHIQRLREREHLWCPIITYYCRGVLDLNVTGFSFKMYRQS